MPLVAPNPSLAELKRSAAPTWQVPCDRATYHLMIREAQLRKVMPSFAVQRLAARHGRNADLALLILRALEGLPVNYAGWALQLGLPPPRLPPPLKHLRGKLPDEVVDRMPEEIRTRGATRDAEALAAVKVEAGE